MTEQDRVTDARRGSPVEPTCPDQHRSSAGDVARMWRVAAGTHIPEMPDRLCTKRCKALHDLAWLDTLRIANSERHCAQFVAKPFDDELLAIDRFGDSLR